MPRRGVKRIRKKAETLKGTVTKSEVLASKLDRVKEKIVGFVQKTERPQRRDVSEFLKMKHPWESRGLLSALVRAGRLKIHGVKSGAYYTVTRRTAE